MSSSRTNIGPPRPNDVRTKQHTQHTHGLHSIESGHLTRGPHIRDTVHVFPESAQTIPARASFKRVDVTNIKYLLGKKALFLDKDSGTYRACLVTGHDNPETARIVIDRTKGPPEPIEATHDERALFECSNGRCARKIAYRCASCNSQHYCSRECAAEHWRNEHHRHCTAYHAQQNEDARTRHRVPFERICVWRCLKAEQPYPLWLTGLPSSGARIMVRNGPRQKFEAATLIHSNDSHATVRFAVDEHKVKIEEVYRHIPKFIERNPFRKYEWRQQREALSSIPESQRISATGTDSNVARDVVQTSAEGTAQAVQAQPATAQQRSFPDHLYYMTPDEEADDERVCVPDEFDEHALDARDYDHILAIKASGVAYNTFMNHPAFNSHNIAYQEAVFAASVAMKHGQEPSEIDIAEMRTQMRNVKPRVENGKTVFHAAEFEVPVRKAQISVHQPSVEGGQIDAVVDSGSSVEAISKSIATQYRAQLKRTRKGLRIKTGNGLITTYEYLPVKVEKGGFVIRANFWVIPELPYDWLIGRKLEAALKILPRLAFETYKWDAPQIDDGEAQLDALDELNDEDHSTSYIPPRDIDLSEVKCGRPAMRNDIESLLKRYKQSIATHETDCGLLKGEQYRIDWKEGLPFDPDEKGIVMAPYTRKRSLEGEYLRQFSSMWDSDVIEESDGPHCISYFGRPKKTGDVRICFDFRLINRLTRRILYEMPRIDELCEKFKGKSFISTLDLKSGYWHIPIVPEHRHRTAFTFGGRLYQWKRLPFGLMNACMFFQRAMDRLFVDFVKAGFVVVYIDDVSIISNSAAEHLDHVQRVLARIAENGIKLRIDKCTFATKRTNYLGFEVDGEGVEATEKYKDKVLNVPRPQRKEEIRTFVGMVQFLHKFIPNLTDDIGPLTNLLKKNVKWKWTDIEQRAFENIRAKIRDIAALHHPDFTKPFHIFTDASQKGLGGALCQERDGEYVPVYHCSRQFTSTQQNWHVSEQELFSAIYCIEKWRNLIQHDRFHVHTDHKNLIQLLNKAENFKTGKLYRWCQRVQDLDFDCHFVSGAQNRFADYLSRNGLYIERMPPKGIEQTKLKDRNIAKAYQLTMMAEVLGMSTDSRDEFVEREMGTRTSAPLTLPDLNKFDRNTNTAHRAPIAAEPRIAQQQQNRVRAVSAQHVPVPAAPRHVEQYERRRSRHDRDNVHDKMVEADLRPVLPRMSERDQRECRTWNAWLIANRPQSAPVNFIEPPSDGPILDFYCPKQWTYPLIRDKQGDDTFCVLISTFLRTRKQTDLMQCPPYWRRHIVDGRFTIHGDGDVLRYRTDDGESAKIVVPWPLRASLLKAAHVGRVHDGGDRMERHIRVNYFWPKMRQHIDEFIAGCRACAAIKHTNSKGRGRMKLFPQRVPFAMISIDIVGPMPEDANGNRYIVSIIDRFTRFCRLIPVKSIRTCDVLRALEDWCSLFGNPQCILSDNGPQFVSYMFGDAMRAMNIECRTTSTYHPECNGMIERLHRWIKERLALIAYETGLDFLRHDDWSPYLKLIAFAYNTTPNRMTHAAPSELVFGYNPTSISRFEPSDINRQTPREYVQWLARRVAILRNRAVQKQAHYDAVRKRGYDKRDSGESYEVGSAVMYNTSVSRTGNARKLLPSYIGPFEILKSRHDGQSYRLRSIVDPEIAFWAPRKHLKAYRGKVARSPVVTMLERQTELWLMEGCAIEEAEGLARDSTMTALLARC